MKAINVFGVSLVVVALSGSAAFAKVTDESKAGTASGAVAPLPKASTLADNVVVSPNNPAPAPAPAPAPQVNVQPAPVNVQPAPAVQPVEAAPTYVEPRRTVVTENTHQNYVGTVFVSALLGGLGGALIGGAIYYLDGQDHPYNIAYWAAGGVLVGTGVGIINVVVDESRSERAVSARERDPVPTYRVSLLKTTF